MVNVAVLNSKLYFLMAVDRHLLYSAESDVLEQRMK